MKQHSVRILAVLVIALSSATTVRSARAEENPAQKPALVVLIVVDQMRGDFLERFREDFGDGGFKRFLDQGAVFTNANFTNGVTKTGAGHATVSTGANPAVHGIASNEWYAPDLNEDVYCVAGKSPGLLKAETLSESFKAHTDGAAMIVSASLKDRSAILLGGGRADLAFWWNDERGEFATSRFYTHAIPNWMREFNATRPADKQFNESWTLLLPESAYEKSRADDVDYEKGTSAGIGNAFPHAMRGKSETPDKRFYDLIKVTPHGNQMVIDAALAVMQAYQLGKDDVPDLLCIGFSSNDECGHVFGPYSREVQDITVRLDRQLAAFFTTLDERVGKGRWVAALTSDHGVGPIPEYAVAKGWGGGRFKKDAVTDPAEAAVRRVTGIEDKDAKLVGYMTPWLYLNEPLLKREGHDVAKVATAVVEELAALEFVDRVIPFTAMNSDDPLTKMVAESYVPGRSGHVYVHVKKFWITGGNAATHGSAHDYDTHVPLLFYGPGIKTGTHAEPADPIDIVPTLCKLLGFTPPKTATGKVLATAVQGESAASATPAQPAGASLSDDEKLARAKEAFAKIERVYAEMDMALMRSLYSDSAVVTSTRERRSGETLTLKWTGAEWKKLCESMGALAKALNDKNTFTDPSFEVEAANVRIRATRYSVRKDYTSPIAWLVGADADGEWRILEENTETQP